MTPPACPKQMVFGPCGGVEADGACELGDRRCAFVDLPTVGWPSGRAVPAAPTAGAAALRELLGRRRSSSRTSRCGRCPPAPSRRSPRC